MCVCMARFTSAPPPRDPTRKTRWGQRCMESPEGRGVGPPLPTQRRPSQFSAIFSICISEEIFFDVLEAVKGRGGVQTLLMSTNILGWDPPPTSIHIPGRGVPLLCPLGKFRNPVRFAVFDFGAGAGFSSRLMLGFRFA